MLAPEIKKMYIFPVHETMPIITAALYFYIITENGACLQSLSGSIRLFGFNSSYSGYVQVCKGGYWTAISYEEENEWTRKNSIVTCRELGFQGTVGILNRDG